MPLSEVFDRAIAATRERERWFERARASYTLTETHQKSPAEQPNPLHPDLDLFFMECCMSQPYSPPMEKKRRSRRSKDKSTNNESIKGANSLEGQEGSGSLPEKERIGEQGSQEPIGDPKSDEENMSWVEESKHESEDEGRAQANTPAKGVVERFEGSVQGRSEPEVPQEEVKGGLADAARPKGIDKVAQENQLTIAEVTESANQKLSDTPETQKEKGKENSLKKGRETTRHPEELGAKMEESSESKSTFILLSENAERDPARIISCPLIVSKHEGNLRPKTDEADVTKTNEAERVSTTETGEVFRKGPIDQTDEANQARPENWTKTGNRPNLVGSYQSGLWRLIAVLSLVFVTIGVTLKVTPFLPESGSMLRRYRLINEIVPQFGLSTWSEVYRDEDGRTRPKLMIVDLFCRETNDFRSGPARPRAVWSHELNDEIVPRFRYLATGREEDSRTRPRLMALNVSSRKIIDFRDNERAKPRMTHSFKINRNASRLRCSDWTVTYRDDDGPTRPKLTADNVTYGRTIDSQNDDRTRPKHAAVEATCGKMTYFDNDERTRPKLTSIFTRNQRTANFRDDDSRTRPKVATMSVPYDKRRKKPPRLKTNQETSAGGNTIEYLSRKINKVAMNLVGSLSATKDGHLDALTILNLLTIHFHCLPRDFSVANASKPRFIHY